MDSVARVKDVTFGSLGERVPFGESDPFGTFHLFNHSFTSVESIREGSVLYYNPSTHTAMVQVFGVQGEWPCIIADEPLSFSFGYSATYPPREGDLVLVYQLDPLMHAGVIIGRIPFNIIFQPYGDKYNDPDQYHRRLYSQDDLAKETWDRNIQGMMKPLMDKNNSSTKIATNFRPTDVYPGEFAHVNQHNCGIKGGMFSATLLGGGASLRLSALSNLARLTCESYQRYSLSGALHEFHNGRYLSSERNIALYQEERLGGSIPQDKVWTEDSEAPIKGENQTMRPRFKELSGFFGHIVSKFCLRPDPSDSSIRVQGEGEPKEEGVFRETVDPSGQYRLSSAGMIAIERTGRIPVPVRKAYPTDNDHQIDKKPEVLKPFEHDESDPGLRQLELFDRQAYDLKNQYSRVDGLGLDYPDYDVPEENDLKPIQDKYDPKFDGNETVKLNRFDKRRAGVYMGEDGSVIIRDAWGSEITMLGGNVTIACAGNVMTLPGQTALTIAGDDIIQKAQNSIDIHASKHDVRLSAARNMEILGGAGNKSPGGVVIQSKGEYASTWDGEDKGESANISGITLISKNQSIVAYGKYLNLRSKSQTSILSGDSDLKGKIYMVGDDILAKSKKNAVICSTGASLAISGKSAALAAEGGAIVGGGSAMIINGSQVPGMWVDGGTKPDPVKLEEFDDESNASFGFTKEKLDKMIFGFRTSVECRTDRSWVIGSKDNKFTLYEPAWVQVMSIYETLTGIDSKIFEEDSEWKNGKPFPGKEADESGVYAQLSGLEPSNLMSGGLNKPRFMVEPKSNIEKKSLKDGYRIRK